MIYDKIINNFTLIHGPCAVESYEQMTEITKELSQYSNIFRGGAYKPRTSPNSFQGLKSDGIKILEDIKAKKNILVVSEITNINDINNFTNIDIVQIGARNMQNYELIQEVAKLNKPIILKRGFGNTVDELISSVKYIEKAGNNKIILCERGIRTFSNVSRFTLDFSAVGYLKDNYDYPVFIDPSHAAGYTKEVKRLTRAAYAYGCDGLIIEVHPNPSEALSDNNQQLTINEYKELIDSLNIDK